MNAKTKQRTQCLYVHHSDSSLIVIKLVGFLNRENHIPIFLYTALHSILL